MMNKQTLMVKEQYNDQIVSVNRARSQYVDDAYFKSQMKENKDNESYKNYPIKMMALRTNWLLTDSGKMLLQAMLRSENLELFNCMTTEVITEFFYKHYKKKILKQQLPVYLLQIMIYFMSVGLRKGSVERIVSDWLNLAACIYTVGLIFMNLKYVGVVVLQTVWVYFDIIYVLANGCVSMSRIYDEINGDHNHAEGIIEEGLLVEKMTVRIIQAFLSIIIFGKLIYFMQLID